LLLKLKFFDVIKNLKIY